MGIDMKQKRPWLRFLGGTLVLENWGGEERVPHEVFEWQNGKWRCTAHQYRLLGGWLKEVGVNDGVGGWRNLDLVCDDGRTPHDYQREGLAAWHENGRWGSIVLPTGAGKTFVALRAIEKVGASTLVVVPTIDLLHQWYARLTNAFGTEIGVWYGGEKELRGITVTTYPSAWAHGEMLGNQFKFLLCDEIHHLPAPNWHEIGLMCAAPMRLGLTATYPETAEVIWGAGMGVDRDRAKLLDELIGPVVYEKKIDELTGKQLADYRTERMRIDLNSEERDEYDTAYGVYTGYMHEAKLRQRYGGGWWQEMTRRSAYDQGARRAKVAERRLKEIVHQAAGKVGVVAELLAAHWGERVLIFTAHNRFAYLLGRRYLLPVITHQTKAAERKEILEKFRG
ncbi:MAG TPA: DEAD/DEAH box helicase, partial [Anaerolineae bacterium]|nr:DEAD/DEAH box helicase [Anaerolineae bacterium]